MLRVIIVLLFTNIAFARYIIIGPAEIKILKNSKCSEYSNYPMQLEINTRMYNKTTQVLNGFFDSPVDIDDNITVSLNCSRIDLAQKKSFVINDEMACSTLTKYVGDLWFDVQRQIGMKPRVCPIKMGNYKIRNLVLDLTKMKVQMILEGTFQTRVIIKSNKLVILCNDFTIRLSPK